MGWWCSLWVDTIVHNDLAGHNVRCLGLYMVSFVVRAKELWEALQP